MAAPFSTDFRARVLAAYQRGMSTKQIADAFGVCPAWARRVKQRHREHGETEHRPMGGARLVKIDRVRLAELVRARPDATLAELREELGVVCALSALWAALDKLGFSFKKRRSMPPSRTAPTWSNAAARGKRPSPASTPHG